MSKNKENEPFHSGEIYHLWAYLFHTKHYLVTLQVFINHTGDEDLKAYLEDLLENEVTQEAQQIEMILKEAGIRLPPAPPDRPNVEVEDIPAGARFHEPEIAILVQEELMYGKIQCSSMMNISIRTDFEEIFGDFHEQKTTYYRKLSDLSKKKGWVVSPPVHIK
ncbi:DUF3231 family protein [Virgibacillus sp. LDC-1]|uniref:DUF3231 family protein n=1 Tax=Virgibacillus sp. LDC-1 TaxID=3039856 RepID=UPI0024DEC271|nr:DUF3231 family protein [Virgibacillus sp. LDC-1]